jgi:raffinose/stachyose/melibiose transport system substrate-binding protein
MLRRLSLAAVLTVGVVVLWPERKTAAAGPEAGPKSADYKYVLRMSVGQSYLPGSVPAGIGEPLQGVAKVVADFEARYPDTKVEVVTVPIEREFLVTQLSGGAAPDIVSVNVEDVWVDAQKQWYVPMDQFLERPNPFVREKGDPSAPGARQWWDMFAYQAITRGKGAPDGKNYCISLDMVETGIFYNKTFFAQHGLRPPESWGEFIALLRRVKELGRTPLLSNIDCLADWGTDLVFDQFYHELMPGLDVKKDDPVRAAYLQGYMDPEEISFLHRQGYFTRRDPRFVEVWRKLGELRPFLTKDINTQDLTREFVNQQAIMLWNGSWFVYRLHGDRQLGFDWGVFYLPPMRATDSPYASGLPMCVIGGVATQLEVTNSALIDTDPALPFAERIARSGRLRRVVELLQFMCLPENTGRIVNEYPAFIPNIIGVPVHPQLDPFVEILKRRYTTTKWVYTFDLRFNEILKRILHLYLTGAITLEEFMHWQEENVTTATENFLQRTQTDLAPLRQEWDRMAPVRTHWRDVPPPPSK